MKKLFAIIILAMIAGAVFTSCDKEDDPQLLSEYIIGEWRMDDVEWMAEEIYFLGEFTPDHYTLAISDGETTIQIPPADYSVNDATNVLSLDEPDMPGEEPGDEIVLFDVDWTENGNTMTWTNLDPEEEEAQVLFWQRQ